MTRSRTCLPRSTSFWGRKLREFLEDAFAHQDDGFGRAQKHVRRELPKRFYKSAGIETVEDGFAITLDGRRARTPGKVPVIVPSEPLAVQMVQEWEAQGEHIDPLTMPVVRLVNSGVEAGAQSVEALRDELIKFVGTDLLYYRADAPRELVAEQERHWDPVLSMLARQYTVSFQTTVGIVHQGQPASTLERLAEAIADASLLQAVAMVSVAGITGSGLLAIGLDKGLMQPDAVWDAAHVDEDYNVKLWGMDGEAADRRAKRRAEFDAAHSVLVHLRAIV